MKRGVNALGKPNEAFITGKEVQESVREMKAGKAAGLDGAAAECLKSGGATVVEWLVKLLNVCFLISMVPIDWTSACVVPLYKDKADKYECTSFRGISLLSVLGVIWDEQGGLRRGRGCVDQIFTVRQVCENYLAKG